MGTVTVPGGGNNPPITYTFSSETATSVAQKIADAMAVAVGAGTLKITTSDGNTIPVAPNGTGLDELILTGSPGPTIPGGYDLVAVNNSDPNTITAGPGTFILTSTGGGIFSETGSATVVAPGGDNLISQSGVGVVALFGGDNSDTVIATGTGTISGGGGKNLLFAEGPGQMVLSTGTDTVVMGAATGYDTVNLTGSSGSIVYGNIGSMVITGSGTNETISAAAGASTIFGGTSGVYFTNNSSATFVDEGGANTVIAGSGALTAFGGKGSNLIYGGLGAMTYISNPNSTATVVGSTSQVTLFGGAGSNTTFFNGPGSFGAVFSAADGNETLNAAGATANVTEWGGVGNDRMIGGSGSDTLVGGSGLSSMTGGAGSDFFVAIAGRTKGTVDITDMTKADTLGITGYGVAATNAAIAAATGSSFALSDGTVITFDNVLVSSVASNIKVG